MDEIRDIFASVDGALPERPFASFTGAGGGVAAAAGRLAPPDGRHYVAYLQTPPRGAHESDLASYVDEDLRLHAEAPGYEVRYLEAFADPFCAGERYRFFWEALHPTPEEDDTDEERDRDRRRGLARIEGFVRERAQRALYDEVLRAEEEESRSADPQTRAFWRQAARSAAEELRGLVPDEGRRERDLALHRYRRAALAADEASGGAEGGQPESA